MQLSAVPTFWALNDGAIIQINLKNVDTYRFHNPPPPLESQSGQSGIQTDPAAGKARPFSPFAAERQMQRGKWKWLGVMAPKRPSEQRNNQLHMSPSTMKGLGLTPGKVTEIKGHKQKKATGKGCELQWEPMWSQLHTEGTVWASVELGPVTAFVCFTEKSSVPVPLSFKEIFPPASRAQETKNCGDKIILESTVSRTGALQIFKSTAAHNRRNSKKCFGSNYQTDKNAASCKGITLQASQSQHLPQIQRSADFPVCHWNWLPGEKQELW